VTETALVLPDHDPAVIDYRKRADAILADAKALLVTDPATKVQAVEVLSGIARLKAESEKQREGLVGPHNDFVRGVNRIFKEVLAPVVEADGLLRQRVRDFDVAERRKAAEAAAAAERARLEADARLKEAAAAEARGDKVVAEELLDRAMDSEVEARHAQEAAVLPARSVKTDVGAAHTRKVWAFKLVNVAQVPAEYLEVNSVAVRRAIAGGVREIPGLEIYQEDQLAVRG
jgi:hypothetical protein